MPPNPRTYDANGKARDLSKKVGRPRKKMGPRPRLRTDITLPRELIDAKNVAAHKAGISRTAYDRLAITSFAKYRLANPIAPRATECSACGRRFAAPRSQGDKKRLRVATELDETTSKLMIYLSDLYFNGTFSQCFEAAIRYYMGDDAPPPAYGQEP